jgi:hypothetical protein
MVDLEDLLACAFCEHSAAVAVAAVFFSAA